MAVNVAEAHGANVTSVTAASFHGNGDPSFGTHSVTVVGPWPVSAAAGDFNQDGRTDLAVVSRYGWRLFLLLNQGTGSFGITEFATANWPWEVAAADVNNDGRTDLAVVASSEFQDAGFPPEGVVGVHLNEGSGTHPREIVHRPCSRGNSAADSRRKPRTCHSSSHRARASRYRAARRRVISRHTRQRRPRWHRTGCDWCARAGRFRRLRPLTAPTGSLPDHDRSVTSHNDAALATATFQSAAVRR